MTEVQREAGVHRAPPPQRATCPLTPETSPSGRAWDSMLRGALPAVSSCPAQQQTQGQTEATLARERLLHKNCADADVAGEARTVWRSVESVSMEGLRFSTAFSPSWKKLGGKGRNRARVPCKTILSAGEDTSLRKEVKIIMSFPGETWTCFRNKKTLKMMRSGQKGAAIRQHICDFS